MGDHFKIRKATVEDLPAMLLVLDEALNEPSSSTEEEAPERLDRWRPRFSNPDVLFLLMEEKPSGQLVGWARGGRAIEVHKMVNNKEYDCEVINIFFRKAYQGQGLGKKLWDALWQDMIMSFKPRNVVVWSAESARGFYKAMGGQEAETKVFDEKFTHYAFVWDLSMVASEGDE